MNYSHLISFAAGVAVTAAAWSYSSRGDTITEQRAIIVAAEQQAARIDTDIRENDANVQTYIDALEEANRMRNDDAISLRVCRNDAMRANVSAANSAALEEQARADNARLKADILRVTENAARLDAWASSCHEFVNRH